MRWFLILSFIIIQACCAQVQEVSAWITWQHNYKTIAGTPLDSSIVAFNIYISPDTTVAVPDTSYQLFTQTQDTFLYLLQYPNLYSSYPWKFYATAKRLDTNVESLPSDTVGGSFPILIPGTPYNLKTQSMEFVK